MGDVWGIREGPPQQETRSEGSRLLGRACSGAGLPEMWPIAATELPKPSPSCRARPDGVFASALILIDRLTSTSVESDPCLNRKRYAAPLSVPPTSSFRAPIAPSVIVGNSFSPRFRGSSAPNASCRRSDRRSGRTASWPGPRTPSLILRRRSRCR